MAQLKAVTRAEHESIERQVDLFTQTRDVDAYRNLLERFLGFYQPFETALLRVPGLAEAVPDIESRLRAGLLRADLAALGSAGHGDDCSHLPELRTVAQAIGCMYVTEGSTLGGQIIARQLRGVSDSLWFFLSYGSQVGRMWKRFSEFAEEYAAANQEHSEAICESACSAFRCMESWIATGPTLARHA